MSRRPPVAVIIPALDEEAAIGKVLRALPDWIDETIVVDNGSSDRTADVAAAAGARVVREPRRGYGRACQAGIAALGQADVVVFLDGDFSDRPQEIGRLTAPVLTGKADLVLGSRVLGRCEAGALLPHQRFGNALACGLIARLWQVRFTDLGPFRAIRRDVLEALQLRDLGYGWTVEMQVKAAQQGLTSLEVPVSYRRRIGRSKISGTLKGTFGAGVKILGVIASAYLRDLYRAAGSRRAGPAAPATRPTRRAHGS